MFSSLTLSLFETALNTALRTDAVAQTALTSQLHGKSIRIKLIRPEVCVDVFFDQNKIRLSKVFDYKIFTIQPNCLITADTLVSLINTLTTSENLSAQKNIKVSGDTQMLFTLQKIITNLQINPTTLIQPFVGARISGQFEQAFTNLKNQTQKTSAQAQFYANEWLTEDNDLLAKHWQMQKFSEDIETFSTNVDSLEAKIARLTELQKQKL